MLQGAQALTPSGTYNPALVNQRIMTSGNVNVTGASAGNYDTLLTIPTLPAGVKWRLKQVDYASATTLAQHGTAILTFTLINKGNSDADMLLVGDANTTKTATGSGVTAYTKRALSINATAANLVVDSGDVLIVRFTSGGAGVAAHANAHMTLTFDEYVL